MKKEYLGLLLFLFSSFLTAQSIHLSLPQVVVNNGETVTLPITVSDFDSIVSLQLSIQWDTDIATFTESALDALSLLAVGDFQADQGELRISWFDNTGNGRSLADGDVIANLTFTAVGSPGDFTLLPFTNEPLAIQIFKATDVFGVFEPISLIQDIGRIAIAAPLGFMIDIQDVICSGDANGVANVSLTESLDDYTISWQGPNGFTASTYDLQGLSGGEYSLIISDLAGVEVFDYNFTLNEANLPLSLSNIVTTNTNCNEANGTLNFDVTGGQAPYTFLLNELSAEINQFSNLSAGVYTLQISDALGCILSEDINIVSPNIPVIELESTIQLCSESITLHPQAIGMYLWSTGAISDTLTITEQGVYSLTVTNEEGCVAIDSIVIEGGAPPVIILENNFPELCPGDSLQLNVSGGDVYNWIEGTSFLSADNISNPLIFPDATSIFSVEVGNNCGLDTLSFEVLVYEIFATAGPDTCIGPDTELELQASGGVFYEWVDNKENLSEIDIPNPTTSPEDSTTYSVIIIDINECVTMDEVTVLVANDPAQSITAYNMISPNGDGKNDVLDFDEISKFGNNSLKVYNRWGDLVYQKRNYQEDDERFDGIYNGELLPAGNYFYVLSFRNGSISQTLTIIRE